MFNDLPFILCLCFVLTACDSSEISDADRGATRADANETTNDAGGAAGEVSDATVDASVSGRCGDGLILPGGQILLLSNVTGEVERILISGDSATVTSVATGLDLPASGVLTNT